MPYAIYGVDQAEYMYVIRILVAASQEYVKTCSTRRMPPPQPLRATIVVVDYS